MNRFDWNLARTFLAVLDHGSLLAAARALGASQPTLGRHVAELEAQLGVVLFERTHFLPQNTLVIVAGDITAADSFRLIERYFSGWKAATCGPD